MPFDLYLSAVSYCRAHSLPLSRIERRGFHSYHVVTE